MFRSVSAMTHPLRPLLTAAACSSFAVEGPMRPLGTAAPEGYARPFSPAAANSANFIACVLGSAGTFWHHCNARCSRSCFVRPVGHGGWLRYSHRMEIVERDGKFWLLSPLRQEGLKPDGDLAAYHERAMEDLQESQPLGPFATRADAENATYFAGDKWPDTIRSRATAPLRVNKIKPAP
jgi:hypothetical protein